MPKTPSRPRQWIRAPSTKAVPPADAEKAVIVAACERLIREILIPRFQRDIRPTEFNYPVGIHGDWRAGRYRFVTRYRSGFVENLGEEFDSPFARLDRMGRDRFDLQWMRHTGQWWRLHQGLTLAEALDRLEHDECLHPH